MAKIGTNIHASLETLVVNNFLVIGANDEIVSAGRKDKIMLINNPTSKKLNNKTTNGFIFPEKLDKAPMRENNTKSITTQKIKTTTLSADTEPR